MTFRAPPAIFAEFPKFIFNRNPAVPSGRARPTPRKAWLWAVAVVIGAGQAGAAWADEVLLKNGDRLSGKIISASDGKLVLAPDFAPTTKVTLSQTDIATFSAAAPLVLKLDDGTVINQPVRKGPAGQVFVAPGGALASQPVDIEKVAAINPAVAPPVAWHGSVGLNGLYSDANSRSMQLGVSASGDRRTASDELAVHLAYNYGRQTVQGLTTTSADNWAAGAKYQFSFAPRVYGYAGVEAAADRINFLDLRFTPSVGGGYRWLDRPDFHVSTDAGLAWIYEDYRTLARATKSPAISLAYHIDRSWGADRVVAFHDLQLLPSLEGGKVLAIADAGLRTNLTKSMYSEVRVDVAYDSDPAPGAKSTSTQLKIGLGWTY